MSSNGDLTIATWSLQDPQKTGKAESLIDLEYANDAPEAVFVDKRKVVPPADIRAGGKYRSIIKLFMKYENNPESEAMGTGWLIAPDVLVTAGHCAFGNGLNRAISIRAYQGYNGKASINSPNVSYRYGVQVATTSRWLSGFTKPGDFAVVKLNKPFVRVQPINFKDTPENGIATLGVVGYPGDKLFNNERGAQMYEMFLPTHFNRNKAENHMLDYLISTFAGQSGSPVLMKEGTTLTSIGVHTYGGRAVNSATVLDSENNVNTYLAFLAQEMWRDGQKITPPAGAPEKVDYYSVPLQESSPVSGQDTESFGDIFKSIMKVALPIASNVVTVGAPFMGPIGTICGPLAGVALQAASKLTESSFDTGTESQLTSALDNNGAVHRAILGEAALQAISRLDEETLHDSGALKIMREVYTANEGVVKNLTPHISKSLLEPTLRVSMDQLRCAHNPGFVPTSHLVKKRAPIVGAESFLATTESEIDQAPAPSFIRDMVAQETEVVDEAFFPDLLNILKKGAIFATPFCTSMVRKGLDKLDQAVASSNTGTESATMEQPESVLNMLPKRALMGEAALQAMIQLPKEYLHAQYPKPGSDSQTEGLLDVFKGICQKIGPHVISAAPIVMKHVAPVVKDLLSRNQTEFLNFNIGL